MQNLSRFRYVLAICLLASGSIMIAPISAQATAGATVTFVQNAGSNPTLTSSQTDQSSGGMDLTLVANLTPSFSDPGYTFGYWSTNPGGGGTEYQDGAFYSFNTDLTLYAQWQGVNHTVTFYENSNSNDQTESYQVANTPTPLTLVQDLSPAFSDPNYSFKDWTTSPDGSGTTYSDGEVFDFRSTESLFAQWTPDEVSLSFSPNSGDGTVADLMVQVGSTANLPSGNSLFKANYSLLGWNTTPSGSGTEYQPGAQVTISNAETFYAEWAPDAETLQFSANTGSGSVTPTVVAFGSLANLPTGSAISKSGSTLIGWNTAADGSGSEYQPGSQITVSGSETFYAIWSRDSYTISFVLPGLGTQTAAVSVLAGNSINLPAAPKSSKTNSSFSGWYTSATGGQFVGVAGAPYTPTGTLTLYAQSTSKQTVGLEFSDNGGVGHVPARTVNAGSAVVVPGGSGLHRVGYSFRGWSSSPHASVPNIRIGSRLILTRTKILYALWRKALPATTPQVLVGNIGIFAPNSSVITPAMRHEIALTAIGINQRNRTMVLIYGYATSKDSGHGSALLSLQRALAVEGQLNRDLAGLNDVGVVVRAKGEGRLTNSVLASFRKVEIFAN